MKNHNLTYRFTAMFILACSTNLLAISTTYALELPATLQWSKRVELGTPISGIIKTVIVNTGDRLKRGESLVKLDARNYSAAFDKATANAKNLREKRKEAQRELDRAQELYDRTVLSDHDLQTAKNAKIEADSDYATAKAELVTAGLNLEYTDIKAPFDAFVLKRHVEVGQTIISQLKPKILVTIAAAGEMIARGYIAQDDLNGLTRGQSATVVVVGLEFDGSIKHVGLEPVKTDKQGIYYEIDIVFNTGERILRAGQQVTIKIP